MNNREVIVVGDIWDYRLRKMELAWELASRVIPHKADTGGRWTEDKFIDRAQETMKKAYEAVDAIFEEDKKYSGVN